MSSGYSAIERVHKSYHYVKKVRFVLSKDTFNSCVSKDIYHVTKYFVSNKCYSFKLSKDP